MNASNDVKPTVDESLKLSLSKIDEFHINQKKKEGELSAFAHSQQKAELSAQKLVSTVPPFTTGFWFDGSELPVGSHCHPTSG